MKKFLTTAFTTLLISVSAVAAPKKFTYDNIIVESLRLNNVTDFSEYGKGWLKETNSDVYYKFQNDEFEFQEKIDGAKQALEKLVQASEKGNYIFETYVNTKFGEYNFSSNKFDYEPFSQGNLYVKSNKYPDSLPHQINIYISNPEIVNGIPMDKEKAKKFMQNRKNNWGEINRSVIIYLELQFEKADDLSNITAKIISYKVMDNKNKMIYTYPETKSK